MATERSGRWAGWIVFGGTMLLVIGSINIFQGVLALVAQEQVVVVARGRTVSGRYRLHDDV